MYYHCDECGKKFKYAVDMIPVFADKFGCCPQCGKEGLLEKEGARYPDDADYFEVEE